MKTTEPPVGSSHLVTAARSQPEAGRMLCDCSRPLPVRHLGSQANCKRDFGTTRPSRRSWPFAAMNCRACGITAAQGIPASSTFHRQMLRCCSSWSIFLCWQFLPRDPPLMILPCFSNTTRSRRPYHREVLSRSLPGSGTLMQSAPATSRPSLRKVTGFRGHSCW